VAWLNGLVTCDLAKVDAGRAGYGLLVEKKGRIETDFVALAGEDALVLALPRELREKTRATLDHYLIMADADLAPTALVFYAAYGPKAAELAVASGAPYAGAIDLLSIGGAVVAGPEPTTLEGRLRDDAARLGGLFGDEAVAEALRIERGVPRFGVEV